MLSLRALNAENTDAIENTISGLSPCALLLSAFTMFKSLSAKHFKNVGG